MITAVVLSPEWADTIRFGLAVLIPLAVGLITKSTATSGLKSTLNIVLAAFVTGVTTILDDADASVANVTREFILTAVASFASYYGVWKPNGLAGLVAAKTPEFGIGSPPAPDLTAEEKGLEDVHVAPAVMEEITARIDEGAPVAEAVVDSLPDDVPEGLTVQATLDWVGTDQVRAQSALLAEEGRDRPRTTVIEKLRVLVDEGGQALLSVLVVLGIILLVLGFIRAAWYLLIIAVVVWIVAALGPGRGYYRDR